MFVPSTKLKKFAVEPAKRPHQRDMRNRHFGTSNPALPRLAEFILPAGTRAASLAHVCRTVARRAERAVVALGATAELNDALRQYLNRLSDLLFVLARVLNRMNGGDDVYWKSERMARTAAADAKDEGSPS